ncbi:MAG: hypothetical protein ACM3VS_02255, partial [Candidatus Dadabacteria bacterium]
ESSNGSKFNDYLRDQIDLKKRCTIKFRSVEGGISTIQAHILDMKEEAGRQMIQTDAGIFIGIDQIVELNGQQPQNYC